MPPNTVPVHKTKHFSIVLVCFLNAVSILYYTFARKTLVEDMMATAKS